MSPSRWVDLPPLVGDQGRFLSPREEQEQEQEQEQELSDLLYNEGVVHGHVNSNVVTGVILAQLS